MYLMYIRIECTSDVHKTLRWRRIAPHLGGPAQTGLVLLFIVRTVSDTFIFEFFTAEQDVLTKE